MITMQVSMAAVAFWGCGSVMVVLALAMVLARKAVHSALCLAGVMVALGILYASLDAPFLFVAQLIVYTGSVMMLFLFTMMLIGIDTAEQMRETIRGQRGAAIVAVLGLGSLLVLTIGHGIVDPAVGVGQLNDAAQGNAQALAGVLFGRFAVAFEAASALVIVAALAAMVLSHADAIKPKEHQRDKVGRRLREYAAVGARLSPEPSPGVYAGHNAATYPALLPTGQGAPDSVAAALRARGQDVVGGPSLIVPVAGLHNQLADQAEGFDDAGSLRAPEVTELAALEATLAADEAGLAQTPEAQTPAGSQPRRGA